MFQITKNQLVARTVDKISHTSTTLNQLLLGSLWDMRLSQKCYRRLMTTCWLVSSFWLWQHTLPQARNYFTSQHAITPHETWLCFQIAYVKNLFQWTQSRSTDVNKAVYLSLLGLFEDALNNFTLNNINDRICSQQLQSMWKEAVVA